MKVIAITQARFSSSRLPGKVLKELGNETVLDVHLRRIKKAKLIDHFVVATTQEKESKSIENIALKHCFSCYHGSQDDVLDRFYKSIEDVGTDIVVRLTSDCPLIDPWYIDDIIRRFKEDSVDYMANCLVPTLPDGMDVEVFNFQALKIAWERATKTSEREHVTPFIRNSGLFKVKSVEYPLKYGNFRLTLDTPEDYEVIKEVFRNCGIDATTDDYINFLESNPDLMKRNSMSFRNEGYTASLNKD